MILAKVKDRDQFYAEYTIKEAEMLEEIVWQGIKDLEKDDPQRKLGELFITAHRRSRELIKRAEAKSESDCSAGEA